LRRDYRRLAIVAHLWLGLLIGGVWALQGLTGAVLVLHREADRALNPPQHAPVAAGQWLPLGMLLAAAGAPADRISIVDGRRDTVAVQVGKRGEKRAIIIEAATAQRLANRSVDAPAANREGALRWLFMLHEALLAGDSGETLVGIAGLLLASGSALGLWIAAPWRRLRPRRGPLRARLWGWHRAVGVLAAAALLLLALTGAYMVWSKPLRPLIATIVPLQTPPETATAAPVAVIGIDAAFAIARRQFPTAAFVAATLPGPKVAEYRFRLRQPGETRAIFGTTTVWVRAGDGRVAWRYDPLHAPLANRLIDAMFSLHNGEIAGWPGRLAVLATGLALPLLWFTGVWRWLLRRRGFARRARPVMVPR
jgi:uncharacterized iron-regulated membrane protein